MRTINTRIPKKIFYTYFMRIANLCRVYPRLLHTTVSSDDMHKYFSYVVKRIEDDRFLEYCMLTFL